MEKVKKAVSTGDISELESLSEDAARLKSKTGETDRMMREIKEKYGFDANAIVTMEEVVDYLHNRECQGRVVIDDENLRGYVYQFLKSPIGQSLLLKNAYGTNQEHLEPDVVGEILIPIPKDRDVIDRIGSKVIASIQALEQSIAQNEDATTIMESIIA